MIYGQVHDKRTWSVRSPLLTGKILRVALRTELGNVAPRCLLATFLFTNGTRKNFAAKDQKMETKGGAKIKFFGRCRSFSTVQYCTLKPKCNIRSQGSKTMIFTVPEIKCTIPRHAVMRNPFANRDISLNGILSLSTDCTPLC
jgi:hypothetical protein